jgi:hypothetical protein
LSSVMALHIHDFHPFMCFKWSLGIHCPWMNYPRATVLGDSYQFMVRRNTANCVRLEIRWACLASFSARQSSWATLQNNSPATVIHI